MIPTDVILIGTVFVGCVYWLWMAVGSIRVVRNVPILDELQTPEPRWWPTLSIVVPACNEVDTLEAAATTLLEQDYPDLELVLIDDRSDDSTGTVVDRVGGSDPRVLPLHIDRLPDGWLGKVHALDEGFARARGEWVLFTDADVHFAPGTLRAVIAFAEQHDLDHLAAAPDIWPSSLVFDSLVSAFMRSFCVGLRIWSIDDPRSSACIGVGAFNLVRREALERTPGFEWLRLEVVDDVGLGLMLKRHGGKSAIINAAGRIGLNWYRSLREMAIGVEKGYSSVAGCSLGRMLFLCLLGVITEMAPVIALVIAIFRRSIGLDVAAVVIGLAFVFSTIVLNRWGRRRILPGLMAPLFTPIGLALLIRAGWLGFRRGGVLWRGTLYPSRRLIEGKRIWLGTLLGANDPS